MGIGINMSVYEIWADTGNVIQRDFTPEELAQREIDAAEYAAAQLAREQEETAKLAAKQSAMAKLAALGLDENEIAAILGGI